MAITQLDKRKARSEVVVSILVPLLVMITSGSGLYLLNTKPVQRFVLTTSRSQPPLNLTIILTCL